MNPDVRVNGEKRNLKLRIETLDRHSEDDRSDYHFKRRILNYDSEWELYHTGTPFDDKIPVTFRFKSTK